VGGVKVDSSIAGNMQAMIDDAKSKGIELKPTSGFRSNAEQQALYDKYGPGRAARPGTSNHEKGLAVDFDLNQPGAANYLQKNANRYGFKVNNQVGGWERWHVSPTGR
jgi:D-alanyl-D-alanine carboxypeptidase